MGGCCGQVYIVISGSGTYHDFQFFCCVKYFCVDHIAADDERVGIFDSFQQFGFFAVFFQQDEFVTCSFYFFADAIHCNFGKWLIGCY